MKRIYNVYEGWKSKIDEDGGEELRVVLGKEEDVVKYLYDNYPTIIGIGEGLPIKFDEDDILTYYVRYESYSVE